MFRVVSPRLRVIARACVVLLLGERLLLGLSRVPSEKKNITRDQNIGREREGRRGGRGGICFVALCASQLISCYQHA